MNKWCVRLLCVGLMCAAGCSNGGAKVDYSDNRFIGTSTRYWRLLETHSWFEFHSDGTGKAEWGGTIYDLVFRMTGESTAVVSWASFSDEKASFRADVGANGKPLNWLSLAGYQHMTINV